MNFGEWSIKTRQFLCKQTMAMPSGIKCLKCKKGDLSERKTKNGDPFVGCSTYPDPSCGFVSWNSKLIKCKHCKGNVITMNKEGVKLCIECKKEQSQNKRKTSK
jgi:ssDNA-binding Zn-finger/Zn-ribbon topoisomerase 1